MGERLYLGSTSIAREEHAGRAFGPEGPLGSGPVVSGSCGAGKLLWRIGVLASLRGRLFRDADFAGFYCPDNGRDSVPPSLLATALLLQSQDKVSDAEAQAWADFDLRWKAALGIEVEERPFAKSTLQVFRAQLILHDKVREVFESRLRLARESGYLQKRGMKVALDPTNILGRGAVKDTCNLLAEGIVKLLRALAAVEQAAVKSDNGPRLRDTRSTSVPASRERRRLTGRIAKHGRRCCLGLWPTRTGCWNYRGRRRGNWERKAPSGSGWWPRRNCWGCCCSRTWSALMTEWASE